MVEDPFWDGEVHVQPGRSRAEENQGSFCSAVTNKNPSRILLHWSAILLIIPGSFASVPNISPHFSDELFQQDFQRECFPLRGGGHAVGFFFLFFANGFLSAVFVSWDISSSIADRPEPHCENSSLAALRRIATMDLSSCLLETGRLHQGRCFAHVATCTRVERPLCFCLSAQYVTCDTKLRDRCKGTPCNRCGSDQANNTSWNVRYYEVYCDFLPPPPPSLPPHQIWVPCWVPGCYRKSSWNGILRNGENMLLTKLIFNAKNSS